MIETLSSILGLVVIVLGIIFIHELGHYVAGRWVVGIPSSDLRLVMTEFPQHVALRDNGEWVGPGEFDRYSTVYGRYDADYEHLESYIGAGELAQTVGVITIAIVLAGSGHHRAAGSIVLISLLMTGFYVGFDILCSTRRGHQTGDFSALWLASPVATGIVLVGFFVPHVLLYLWI